MLLQPFQLAAWDCALRSARSDHRTPTLHERTHQTAPTQFYRYRYRSLLDVELGSEVP